jgi:hypothetical protein
VQSFLRGNGLGRTGYHLPMNNPPSRRSIRAGRFADADRRVRERRVLAVGLILSLAVHVVVIAVVSGWLEPEIRYRIDPSSTVATEPEAGMRAVALSGARATGPVDPTPTPPPTTSPESARERVAEAEETERRDPDETRDPVGERARVETRTAAERLAPRVVDPRLWRPMIVLPRELDLDDVQERIGAAMEMLSDSALAEAERAMRALDWTVEDADGGRWGISPNGLHLGSLTLPLPIFFPVDMEQEARNAYWRELELQLDRADFLENFDARVKAIRERRDRERSERRSNDGG